MNTTSFSQLPLQKISVLIAEDHVLLRQTWSTILNMDSRFSVIGECSSGEEAVTLAASLQPQVVLMDINLPGINGIEATERICQESKGPKVLGVSMHNQPAYARRMMKSGAMGYIAKNSPRQEMTFAIEEVHHGRKYICHAIKNTLAEEVFVDDNELKGRAGLSNRELEIIEQVRIGASSKEIAETLGITVKTVEVHRYNILKKLKLKNVAQLVSFIGKKL